jgi:uncharacterized protein (TIGR02453 family)
VAFVGFPAAAVEFYQQLELENSREAWLAHRRTYEGAVRAPMLELIAELEPEFGPAKLFRPHRDTRFSKDKSPYKTHQGGYVRTAEGMGWYVQISGEGLLVAGGFYQGTPDQLARYRSAVQDEGIGARLEAVVAELTANGLDVDGDVMRTRPRGVPLDHPRIDLLRHRTLTAGRAHGEPDWLATPEALDRVRADWRRLRPLVAWLADHVGAPVPAT